MLRMLEVKKIKANVSISNDIGNKFIMVNASFKEE